MIFHAGVSEGLPGVSPRSVMYGPRSHVFNGPSAAYEYVFQTVACCSELARGFRESVGGGSLTVVGLSLLVMATHWVSSTFTARGHRDFPRIVWTTHDHVKNQIATHEITASEAVVLNPNTRKSPQRSQKQKAAGRLVRTKLIPVSNATSVSETREPNIWRDRVTCPPSDRCT